MPVSTEIIPLGVSGAIPAYGRHLSACALRRDGRVLLFDCGEGTQYQLLAAGVKRSQVEAIFITHTHGDHLYGLPGVLTTFALLERTAPLTIVGPRELPEILSALPGLRNDWLPFEIEFFGLDESLEYAVVYETNAFTVEARPLDHRIFAAGYRFQERVRPGKVDAEKAAALGVSGSDVGRLVRGEAVTTVSGRTVQPDDVVGPDRPGVAFAYCLDTAPCPGGRALAEGADLVLHDATFGDEHEDRAVETGHSTARQAAHVAHGAKAKALLLSHFSARYPATERLVAEAREVFQNTEAAHELEIIRLEPED